MIFLKVSYPGERGPTLHDGTYAFKVISRLITTVVEMLAIGIIALGGVIKVVSDIWNQRPLDIRKRVKQSYNATSGRIKHHSHINSLLMIA